MAQDIQNISGTQASTAARLCNFPTGKSEPIDNHKAWLTANVLPVLASTPNAWVDLIGHASRRWLQTGGLDSHQLNYQLSFRRCEAVKQYIKQENAKLNPNTQVHFNIEQAEGDTEALMPNPDDGYDRAVEVLVYASKTKPPKPPKPPTVTSLRFEIRIVKGASGGKYGVQADNYQFQIVDLTRRLTAYYHYTGLATGGGVAPGSFTLAGPPAPFSTTRDTQLYMFNSTASLYQDPGATVGPFSIGGDYHLTIKDIHDSSGLIPTRPRSITIKGGSGFSLPSISAGEGTLALTSGPKAFTRY